MNTTELQGTAPKRATFPKRLMAYNIDITIFMVVIIPMALLIENNLILYVSSIALLLLYHAIMESSTWQGTIGKHYSGLIVVTDDLQPIGFVRALVRVLAKCISLGALLIGFLMIYFRKDRKALHDLICGTLVIESSSISGGRKNLIDHQAEKKGN